MMPGAWHAKSLVERVVVAGIMLGNLRERGLSSGSVWLWPLTQGGSCVLSIPGWCSS